MICEQVVDSWKIKIGRYLLNYLCFSEILALVETIQYNILLSSFSKMLKQQVPLGANLSLKIDAKFWSFPKQYFRT